MPERSLVNFSDHAVEQFFHISVSKLRTAQRFQLIESSQERRNRRITRVWDAEAVMRVYVADELSRWTAMPFNVSVQVFAAGPVASWALFDRAAFEGRALDRLPRLKILNRTYVIAIYPDENLMIGEVDTDSTGRSYFKPGRKYVAHDFAAIVAPQPLVAFCEMNFQGPIEMFRQLLDDAVSTKTGKT